MKIFQFLQTQYAIVGIVPPSDQSSKLNLFARRIVCNSLLCFTIVSQFVYIFYVANDFMEYVECVCAFSASTILFVWFLAIVHREATLFENIDSIEKLIDTSKMSIFCNQFIL